MTQFTFVQKIAIYAVPVLLAIIVHEVAHGWVAERFGDKTARLSGRLTLNPIPHIDPVGTILLPLVLLALGGFLFGWAKPVPVDPRNMRNPRSNMVVVAAAGPLANIVMAVLWALALRLSYNVNPWFGAPLSYMSQFGVMINLTLAVLNFLPIPPLDGGRILMNIVPQRLGWQLHRLEPYGFFVLILLMVSGVLSYILWPPILFLMAGISWLVGVNIL